MDKQRDDDGIWQLPDQYQNDAESGIDKAIEKTGRKKGWYSNKINQNFNQIQPYLEPSFTTPSGVKLGSSGRRNLVEAFCLDDTERFDSLLK